ncbi:30S ribosomal protein S6 [Natranaerobius trueperi]|uniref:Small ribosomal subunit protein bS6 n=1 Tax=Natranaerobius trueperi TaxID=759412 RepID=A0A226BZD3_9FIRM|nr:30S ribosomal protein S6 [Natranaerobius trueperi]OWZ83490.1 30S ribosomal protein S6 [Natranaerobius trueperi]
MRKYEVVTIFTPDLEEKQVEEANNWIKSIIEKYDGEVQETEKWGKKRLAYSINDYQEGIYSITTFTGDKQVTEELERSFRMSEQVIRYLITRLDD